ncbi:MAG: hypothetical protein ACLQQ4_18195 [Bacteroidia bacterium]
MKKLFLYFTVLSIGIAGCKSNSQGGDKVKIDNKLDKSIVCILGYNYPDLGFKFTSKEAILANSKLFEIAAGQTKEIDTLGLCDKETFDKNIKQNLLMLFVFDKDKLATATKLDDALTERYYFTYVQLMKTNGVITIDASKNGL